MHRSVALVVYCRLGSVDYILIHACDYEGPGNHHDDEPKVMAAASACICEQQTLNTANVMEMMESTMQ